MHSKTQAEMAIMMPSPSGGRIALYPDFRRQAVHLF